MKLNNAQEAARPALMEDQSDGDNGHSADSDGIEMNRLRRWQAISITSEVVIIGVSRHCRLSENCIRNTM